MCYIPRQFTFTLLGVCCSKVLLELGLRKTYIQGYLNVFIELVYYIKMFIYNQIVWNTNVYTYVILYMLDKIQLCSETRTKLLQLPKYYKNKQSVFVFTL